MDIVKTNNQANQQVATYQPPTLPGRLQSTILALGAPNQDPETRQANKLALIQITNELMPGGKPNYLQVVKFPPVASLVGQMGEPAVLLNLSIMVREFFGSLIVVRNMNEVQILEAAAMLLNECDNFRLEDYTMMFALARKGDLVKIYDRIDLQVITAILDAYWERRHKAGQEARDADVMAEAQVFHPDAGKEMIFVEGVGYQEKPNEHSKLDNVAGAIGELARQLRANNPGISEAEARQQINKNPNYKNNHKSKKRQ